MTPIPRREPPGDKLMNALLWSALAIPAVLVITVLVYVVVGWFT